MTKKKIAIFSGGWGGEFLHDTLSGIREIACSEKVDIFSFVNFSIRGDHNPINNGETNIFRLPDINDFDGVMLFANTFNRQWEIDYLTDLIEKSNIPCITLEYPIEGMPCISSDNRFGMRELVEHMIDQHGCREILYISGPKDHPEAVERLETFKEVMEEKQIPCNVDNIAFGDWSKTMIPGFIEGWVAKKGDYPEAIICANDIMAIGVSNYLREKKVSIPDRVKVTGYDRIRMAQTLVTPIASVNHEWTSMGAKALESLLTLIKGEALESKIMLKTKFVPNRSCGCIPQDFGSGDTKSDRIFNDFLIEPIDLDSHFRHFYSAIRKADERESVWYGFANVFEREHIMEGDDFKLCLVPNFFDYKEDDTKLPIKGYADEMELACYIKDGELGKTKKMSLNECIHEAADRKEEADLYIFMPLYSEVGTYGFAMLNGSLNAANENQYYIWSRHMINALEQVRSNMKLATLWDTLRKQSITDQLTGVYNRHGCEQYIYEDIISFGQENGESILFLVDVDHMKIINDRRGHAIGDLCLKLVAQAMQESIPKELSIARFGGDEFIIGGRFESVKETPEEIMQAIDTRLAQLVEKHADKKLELTVSSGYSRCILKDIADIEKNIVIADQRMYAVKEIHHNR